VADMVIPFGRYGLFVWPMWSWPIWFVADIVVADMVCGRYGTDPLAHTISANTYRIGLPRIRYEPPGRRPFKNRLSTNVFMRSLAFHRNLRVSSVWVIFTYL